MGKRSKGSDLSPRVYIALSSGYEHTDMLGVNSSLEDAMLRFEGIPQGIMHPLTMIVVEIPLDHVKNFDSQNPKKSGAKIHTYTPEKTK